MLGAVNTGLCFIADWLFPACRLVRLLFLAPLTSSTAGTCCFCRRGWRGATARLFPFRHRFVACQLEVNHIWDLVETAAMIANCDLVTTISTAVARLAGAMGQPTWLLLHKVPDWRRGLKEEISFWYPSMCLFANRSGATGRM